MYMYSPGASGHKGIYTVITTFSNSLKALVEFFLLVSRDICLSKYYSHPTFSIEALIFPYIYGLVFT